MRALRYLVATLATLATFIAVDAQAQTLVIEAPSSNDIPTTDSGVGLNAFDVDVTLQLPAGYYTGITVALELPDGVPAVTRIGTASPTSGEFDNAVYDASTNAVTWTQVVPLDLTAGAGVRKFRLNTHLNRYQTRVGTPFVFVATASGDVDAAGVPLPFAAPSIDHTVVATGPGPSLDWYYSNSGYVRYGVVNRGWGLSSEPTPRPGLFRRLVFALGNNRQSPMDPAFDWSIAVGANYYVVAAGGALDPVNYTAQPLIALANVPAPYTKPTGNITAHFEGPLPSQINLGTVWVDVFVPCADMALSSGEASAAAASYTSSASASSSWTDYDGTSSPLALAGAAIAGPDLTLVCGSGGSLTKTAGGITESGTRFDWRIDVSAPIGTSSIEDAMVVDELSPDIASMIALTDAVNTANIEDYTFYFCDFAGVLSGQFDVTTFLGNLGHCRTSGFQVGDTHFVAYSPLVAKPDGAPFGNLRLFLVTRYSEAWSLANIGYRIPNRAYFQGDTLYGQHGDTLVEATNEDPWEDLELQAPVPGLNASLVVSAWSVTTPIDANAGSGTASFSVSNNAAMRYPLNPSFELEIPDGVIVNNVTFAPTNCESPVPAGAIPTPPYGPTIPIHIGDPDHPWRLALEACGGYITIAFTIDPSYPFIDRQAITFRATADADNAASPTQATLSPRVLVTTGMDVLLSGGCWTDTVWEQAPPANELVLYEAKAVNRGSEDLDAMELRFIVPPGSTYRTAFAGRDFPSGALLEASHDGGNSWFAAPTSADSAITDVRVAGFTIVGAGVDALRPTFYVAVKATVPSATITGLAWVETPTASLGRTPEKDAAVDASVCRVPCDCPDPTPDDACSTGGCDEQGACIVVNQPANTPCMIEGDRCVIAYACGISRLREASTCNEAQVVDCDDQDTCTNDECNPFTGQCENPNVIDCEKQGRPIYLPLERGGLPVGSVLCHINEGVLSCDEDGGRLVLHDELTNGCQ